MRHALGLAALLLALSGCATQEAPPAVIGSTQGTTLVQVGRITEVRDRTIADPARGVGAMVGTVVGAVLGSTIGSGYGSTAASVGGSIAGGVAGNAMEKSANTRTETQVTVQLDSGELRTYSVTSGEVFRVGDPVRIVTRNGISQVTR
ncbi:outer membrane lipoprotein SlyB [Noviherbaspirillum humi]|uniref:Outer membrane lipoprotein SlyB n=1 Tax=Noviherbaspirillum humi TaxID=1688639 RepID=A0A239CRV1_9BURK|nr:glycine zipper 2TM domain-containing protein [Noviherbaspirillum humi]SNS22669.1 outer membrane lipoprotein SlyB [Noviherbaspirillum humi]